MPGQAYWRPRARAYPFNYSYYLQDLKPATSSTTTTYTYKGLSPSPVEKPGRFALEDRPSRSLSRERSPYRYGREGSLGRYAREGSLSRYAREGSLSRYAREGSLSRYAREGSVYRYRATSAPPPASTSVADDIVSLKARLRASEAPDYDLKYRDTLRRFYYPYRLPIQSEVPGYLSLSKKHPYRLPVEDVRVPPHESSIWPLTVPHFNLVSSYDLMIGFLGIRNPYWG